MIAQNIYSYVTDPFTPEASFNWKLFIENTKVVAQMADNLVDLEIELINKILNKVENDPEPDDVKAVEKNLWMNIRRTAQEARRCGVGLTALGDAIAALNMRYGSSESIEFCDQLGKVMAEQLHWRSIELAQERGPFLVWDYAKEKDDQYINEVILKDAPGHIKEMYMEHGRRNLAMLTIAPTGSVSTMTQTTSGCEPVFLIQYKRNRKIADNENAVVDFVDQVGDRWTSYMVDHHGFARFKKITGIEDPEKSPYWKSTSADVDWTAGVKIQATLQRYIDHSISKTCNLPNEATQELVSEVYLAAYKEGCKGFTVYRDGSRTGVLVAIDKKPEVSSNRIAKARKPYLPGQVHITKVKGQDFAVVLGIDEGMPYEVFGGRIAKEVVSQLKAIEHPIIHKIKISKNKSVYRILEGNIERVGDLTSLIDDEESGAVTRLVSLALRHGASPQFVAEQLKKTEEARFDSIGKALSRILKNFIPNGVETKEVFEDCKTKEQCSVVYQDGCVTCTQCGKSKCG